MTESKSDVVSATEDAPAGRLSTASSKALVTSAGREMDALVAEKVMGLLEVHARGEQWVSRSLELEALHGGRFFAPVRPYSTSIADAWLVVERMRGAGADLDLFVHSSLPEPWTARFPSGPEKPQSHYNVHADTAPLAICRAALRALDA